MAKLTQEELEQITSTQKQINQNLYDLGQVEVAFFNASEQAKAISKQKEEVLGILVKLSQNELELLKSLEGKYGKGNINLETGEITQ